MDPTSKVLELAMASVGVDTWPWAWERSTDLRALRRSVPVAAAAVDERRRNGAQARGLALLAVVLLMAYLLAGCHVKKVYKPARPGGVRPPSESFECHPSETWGECVDRVCQGRARCL